VSANDLAIDLAERFLFADVLAFVGHVPRHANNMLRLRARLGQYRHNTLQRIADLADQIRGRSDHAADADQLALGCYTVRVTLRPRPVFGL